MRGGLMKWLLLGCSLVLAACNAAAPDLADSGPLRCVIQRKGYGAGALNPADSCQVCNPSLETSAWTSQPDLTDCSGSDAGTFCQLGQCVEACGIEGLVILAGVTNPDDACQVCAPTEALGTWSLKPGNPSCSDGGVPDAGPPDAGPADAGTPDAGLDAGLDAGTCVIDGAPCDAGGTVCVGGACLPGCYIDQGLVAPHQFQSETQDACCNPALSVGAWTPGFRGLTPIAMPGVSAIASAGVTTSNAQLIVGTSAGALVLLTQLAADGGLAPLTVIKSGPPITAVAAVDVNGDQLTDLLYLNSTSPTLLVQNLTHGFNAPEAWPAISHGGGLWAEKSIYGPQILSFDLGTPEVASSLQPQIDATGHLLDTCPVGVTLCTPMGLAFGSFREVGNVEFVMTCELEGNNDTLYGGFSPGNLCNGDGGWDVRPFSPENPAHGEVYGPVVAAGDLNGDGLSEVVGGGERLGIGLLMNLGPDFNDFADSPTPLPLPGGANVTSLQIANLRGDAGGNIIGLDVGNGTLDVFYPSPPYDAGVALTASYPIATQSVAFAVGDFNADGRPDVAVANANGVQVFQRQCP